MTITIVGMDDADPLLAVEPAVGDWPSASGAAEWLSGCRSVKLGRPDATRGLSSRS
jgi:hypothetical protein